SERCTEYRGGIRCAGSPGVAPAVEPRTSTADLPCRVVGIPALQGEEDVKYATPRPVSSRGPAGRRRRPPWGRAPTAAVPPPATTGAAFGESPSPATRNRPASSPAATVTASTAAPTATARRPAGPLERPR